MKFKCPVRTTLLMPMRIISVLMLFLMLLPQFYNEYGSGFLFFVFYSIFPFYVVYMSIAINLAISFIKPVKWLNCIVSVATLVFILFSGWEITKYACEIVWPYVLTILLAVAGAVISFLPQKSKV